MKWLEKNLLWFAGGLFLVVVGVIVYMAVAAKKTAKKTVGAKAEKPITDDEYMADYLKNYGATGVAGTAARKTGNDAPIGPVRYKTEASTGGVMFPADPDDVNTQSSVGMDF